MAQADRTHDRVEGLVLIGLFTLVTAGLLVALPFATRPGPATAGWWTRPALMPSMALGLLLLANAATLARDVRDVIRRPLTERERREGRLALRRWLFPAEFAIWFLGYVLALPWIGYLPATTLFIGLMLWRAGLREARWLARGVLAALALTAVFRWGLGLWMPQAALYDLAPPPLGPMLTRWF